MKKWALITGASAGIGYELTKLFAADGYNLALLARNEQRLKTLSDELIQRHRIESKILACDLAKPGAASNVFESLRDTPISVLVNNAGFGWQGAFTESELALSTGMLETNVTALVELSYLFARPMLSRREGRILNVASTAAFQPGPFTAMYYASKAFVFSFSVALAGEFAGTGVTVTTLCPGFTRTEFHERAQMKRPSRLFRMMSAEKVARLGYAGLMQGKPIVIPGLMNKITSALARSLPATFTAKIVRKINGK